MNSPREMDTTDTPTLVQAARLWFKIGVLSFGGPAAQIALMHKEVVEARGWLSERQYLNALNFCMLLPGPEAMQLATYAGWRLHGTLGGLIAGLLFVLPGAAVIMALAAIYSAHGEVALVQALFYGIKAAVLVIVIEALLRVARRALQARWHWLVAALAFIGIFFLAIPYPLIVLGAGLYGWWRGHQDIQHHLAAPIQVSPRQTARTIALWLSIWLVPLLALGWGGAPPLLFEIGRFFSQLAVVTFGGAYAVLAYMAQDVVVQYGWLSADEMIDALGLAETTPGPLILVTEFVGFIAGYKEAGLGLAIMAALVTLWVTFIPCFLWIFSGAPYIEWISNQPRLRGALTAITAAVVGVILNLSVWFGLHVLFGEVSRIQSGPLTIWQPELASVEWLALILFALSAVLVFRWHWGVIRVLILASLLGAAVQMLS